MPHSTDNVSIRRVDPTITTAAEIVDIFRNEGGLILEKFLSKTTVVLVWSVDKINAELEEPLNRLAAGSTYEAEHIGVFHGTRTKRMTNVVVIEIGPGNMTQPLDRDANQHQVFSKLGLDGPEGVANFLCALTDCTDENGATRIVPGSNKWPDWSVKATQDDTIPAELKGGDFLLINGRILHGGGANRTQDERRRVISWSFIPSFLTPEEAYPFIVPMDVVKTLSPRGQRMLGFRSQFPKNSHGMWQADYSELADVLKLEGRDPEIERLKAAGRR